MRAEEFSVFRKSKAKIWKSSLSQLQMAHVKFVDLGWLSATAKLGRQHAVMEFIVLYRVWVWVWVWVGNVAGRVDAGTHLFNLNGMVMDNHIRFWDEKLIPVNGFTPLGSGYP
ncbi:hypothetical protein PHJA_001706800 [Phtheirospermum japonicum]|uniref:Uncharacterized protein n=1 Tax=Phtheirospermum japonicum TaxID=374723 RepID=A0A830C8Z7_9LAMI|nr:hypothetical protein PHJA_001706800 [Phtheirospermum japonicum]